MIERKTMKHRIRTELEREMWAAYFKLQEELNKLGKKILRVQFDIAYGGGAGLHARATIWSD